MLKSFLVAASAAAFLVVPLEALQQAPDRRAPKSPTTLTGCISATPAYSGEFTFSDSDSGGKFRLSGKNVRKYAGQRVEIVGGPQGKRLSIRGGLWPSPNVAAQAGAIDAAQAAIASQPGGGSVGTAGLGLPEFRVIRVRGVEGACK